MQLFLIFLINFITILLSKISAQDVYTYSNLVDIKQHPAYLTHHYIETPETTTYANIQNFETITDGQTEEESDEINTTTVPPSSSFDGNNEELPQEYHVQKILQSPRLFAYSDDTDEQFDNENLDAEKYAKGGGLKHYADHEAAHGANKDRGYDGFENFKKHSKGDHKKEGHKGVYKDKQGKKRKKNLSGKIYKDHGKAEIGHKLAKFDEAGGHKKGHQTKGNHKIHKKDEYLKKHEFYDEYHEGGDHEKHGGYEGELLKKKGKKKQNFHGNAAYKKGHAKKKGKFSKGKKKMHKKGYTKHEAHKGHYRKRKKHGKKGKKSGANKWSYIESN